MKQFVVRTLAIATIIPALALFVACPASAGTKFQTSLVPNIAGAMPGFSANGSSIKINGHRSLKGKIKKVVDGAGALVTTDDMNPADNYTVEVDLSVPATAVSGTITVSFDVKNGNGTFAADVSGDPVFAGATLGDGVAVTAIRVKDNSPTPTTLGVGGFAVE